METGDVVYVALRCNGGVIPVLGWIVELTEEEAVVAASASSVESVTQKILARKGDSEIAFLRVAASALTLSRPENWTGGRVKDLAAFGACRNAWEKASEQELLGSEADALGRRAVPKSKAAARKDRLGSELAGLASLYGNVEDDEDEDSEGDSFATAAPRFLAPGQSAKRKDKKKEKKSEKAEPDDLKQLMLKSLAAGEDSSKMMQLMLMSMLLEKDQGARKKKKDKRARSSHELLGSSSSGDTDSEDLVAGKGMKAVVTLQNLHRQIHRKPERVCELFEREVVEELGIVAGQAWTLRDYLKKQNWGRFKGLYRCAVMDAAAYELMRAGRHEVAAAQLVQNLKAKIQAVLQGGDWSTAWLLTGLADPLLKKEWAGSKEEMAVVSGYLEALTKLRKKVAQGNGTEGEDEEQPASSSKK